MQQDVQTEATCNIQKMLGVASKEGKRRLSKCEIVLMFWAKHENEVEEQQSEKLPIKQKCQSLFT